MTDLAQTPATEPQSRRRTGQRPQLRPVFVIGCQRSGTTMLGAMLGAHPEGCATPEGRFIADLAPADPGETLDLAAVIDRIAGNRNFKNWAFDLGDARPEGKGSFADAIRWLVRRYAEAQGRDPDFWVDHAPTHTEHVRRLRDHFPSARFAHIVRDGRGVAASIIPLEWGPRTAAGAAHEWLRQVAFGLGAARYLPPEIFHEVRYESVVTDPEPALRDLAAMIGVDFHPDMIAGRNFRVTPKGEKIHPLVGSKPDPTRTEAWRKSLTPRQIEIFEHIAGDMLPYLGYEPVHARPRGRTKAERRVDLAREVYGRLTGRWP